MPHRLIVASLIAILCRLSPAASQVSDTIPYITNHFTDENGLPQNSIKDMILHKGILWLCTESGLVRYDGQQFTTFTNKDIPGLVSARMINFRLGRNDTLYAFAEDQKVVVIYNNHFSTVPYNTSIHGVYWYYTRFPNYHPSEKKPFANLPESEAGFREIYDTAGEKSLIRYQRSLAWYNKDELEGVTPMPDDFDRDFIRIVAGKVYYLSKDWRLTQLSPRHSSITQLKINAAADEIPQRFRPSEDGSCYIITNKAIYVIKDAIDSGVLNKLCTFPSYNAVDALIQKPDGTLIIGTSNNGLYILTPTPFRMRGSDLMSAKKTLSVFYAQTALPSGTVFASYGTYFPQFGLPNPVESEPRLHNRTLFTDEDGYTWFAIDSLLFRQRLPSGERKFIHKIRGILKVLFKDNQGTMWVVTTNDIAKIDSAYTLIMEEKQYRELLAEVDCIGQGPNNSILLGTARGLFRYDGNGFQILEHTSDIRVRYIKADGDRTWIATYGNGFGMITGNKLFMFPWDRNGYLQYSHCLAEDKAGFFWIPTNKGLFQVRKQDLIDYANNASLPTPYYYYYNAASSGFKTNEFNGGCQPSYIELGDGTLSFPTMNGLLQFNPQSVNPNLTAGPITLLSAVLNETTSLDLSKPIVLPREYGSIRFSFSSAYWGLAENERWEFRLSENAESTWQPVSPNKEILVGQLEGGSYYLSIRKSMGFGFNQFDTLVVKFQVTKRFTETTLFRVLLGVLLLAAFFIVLYVRTRLLQRQKLRLQKRVREKTARLEANNYIKNKLISLLSHDIATPLQFISMMSGQMEAKAEDPESTKRLAQIRHSADQLSRMSDDLLNWLKTQESGFRLEWSEFNLHELVNEKLAFFQFMLEHQQLEISNLVGKDAIVQSDRRLLAIILHNVLSNAIKFTITGSVTVQAAKNVNHVSLTIVDTGMGMTAEKLAEIRNAVGSAIAAQNTAYTGKGIGLILIRDLARILKIRMTYASEKNKGTTVTINIPLRQHGS